LLDDSDAGAARQVSAAVETRLSREESRLSEPIILLSVCPRSGSNYLEALLSLHPKCRKSRFPEDFFLANSETLLYFCRSVAESWDDWWRARLGGTSRLAAHLGEALLRFADPAPEEGGRLGDYRVMLRAPTIAGVDTAATLFPNAYVVVLVRDGPATVESGRKSFGWPYEEAILAWRQSVRHILNFMAGAEARRCRLIRFEDLVADPADEIARVIDFLGLDPALYPFGRVDEVPVFGSSSFGREPGERVHWRPIPRDASFDPLARAQSWPRRRLERFTWIAGAEQRRIGYPVRSLSARQWVRNVVLDCLYGAHRIAIQIFLLPLRQPRIFSDRRRRYFSWRRMTRPGDAVEFAWRNWRRSRVPWLGGRARDENRDSAGRSL
jgi:Sulfotransferase family